MPQISQESSFGPESVRGSDDDIAYLRSLTLEERAQMLASACRAAARIQEGRLASGLPPAQPAPWPASTLEFMRRHAPNARSR